MGAIPITAVRPSACEGAGCLVPYGWCFRYRCGASWARVVSGYGVPMPRALDHPVRAGASVGDAREPQMVRNPAVRKTAVPCKRRAADGSQLGGRDERLAAPSCVWCHSHAHFDDHTAINSQCLVTDTFACNAMLSNVSVYWHHVQIIVTLMNSDHASLVQPSMYHETPPQCLQPRFR